MGKEAFFEQYKEFAIQQQIKYGIPASVTLAQAAIESSYGDNVAAKQANNFFGIHAVPAWLKRGDPVIYFNDASQRVPFTKHDSPEASFEYHSKFLLLNSRQYGRCFGLSATDADGWAKGICEGGYAERKPGKEYAYYNSMMAVIKQNNLQKYDLEAAERAKSQNLVCGYDRKNISVDAPRPAVAAAPRLQQIPSFDQKAYCYPIAQDLKQTDYFGRGATGYRDHQHNGIDLSAKYVDVFATENQGRVVDVGTQKGGGNYVMVEYDRQDGSKWRVSYCHLDHFDVKEGDIVNAGDKLGLSGATGNCTAPHLHLTVKHQPAGGEMKTVNPLDYLAEISVRGNLDGTVTDKNTGKDLLASRKASVDLQPTAGDVWLAQNAQSQSQQQNDLALQQQQMQQGQQAPGQQQQVSTPGGLATLLWGDKAKDMDLGFGGSGDLIGDLFAMLLTGVVAMFASVNKTTEQEVQQQMDQQQNKKEEEKYDATVDRSLVAEAKAKGVDPKVLEQQTQLQADAGLGELDQQRQQQRGMSMS